LLLLLRRAAWPLLLVSVLVAGLAVYYTWTNLTIRTSRNDLVASDSRLLALSDRMDQAFGGRDGLVVVVENGHPERSVRFAQALAVELRQYPQQFAELFYRLDPEALKRWALLYLDPKELRQLTDNLASNQTLLQGLALSPRLTTFYEKVNEQMTRAMIGNLFTGFLEQSSTEDLPDLSLLNASLKQLLVGLEGGQEYTSPFLSFFPKELADLSQEGYFFTENDRFLLFLVTPKGQGYAAITEDLALLRQVVDRVKAQFPGIQVGVTGPDALEADEMSSSLKDISLATWLSLASQMLLLIIFFRSLRRTLVEGVVLIIGLCWTFGLVTLTVGHLNLLSMIFAPLMLGLTIDYGVHWFCRLEEEARGDGPCTLGTLACTYQKSAPGIIYAGLAAAVSFLPLAFVGFKGLAELGIILTLGILVMLAATLILVPALVLITEHCPATGAAGDCAGQPRPFLHLNWSRPWPIVLVGVMATGLGGVSLSAVPFDLNPLHLQNQKVESVVWEYKLIRDSKYSTSYGAMASASMEELEARIAALKKLPTVSHVESILSFLPGDIGPKRKLLEQSGPALVGLEIPPAITFSSDAADLAVILGRIKFKIAQAAREVGQDRPELAKQLSEADLLLERNISRLQAGPPADLNPRLAAFSTRFFADLQDKMALFNGYVESALRSPPPTLADLPEPVRQRFVSPQGTFLIRVFPSQDIWNFGPLKEFVQSLWNIDPNAVGDPVLLYVFTLGFRNACLWAAGIAILAISVMLLFFFRSLKMALLALLPLIVGTGLTLNLMWLLNISFNQANVLFLPLILGEGIEFGIIILARWQLEESARAITLPASTAKGVALAALTTTMGFGSLMVSGHQGTFSLGLLATVGSLSVLLASLSVLPGFLRLVETDYPPGLPSVAPYLSPGRWVQHMIRKK
jgi:hopanoid biosynthesis associated RND transporter like protein HpnN